ncbi:MAG: hypothetical protein JXB05_06600 [Myxococcaceae bacterium]|nr:hypothetical protein [Myxococcaceae bacterium]
MNRKLTYCLLAVLTAATAAHADAIDDVRRGTNLRFIHAQARLDGETFTAGEWLIPKPAGTLDITVPLSHLGISHPDSVRLTGARSGSTIIWTFNQSLSPTLISGSTHIERLSGQIVAQALLVPGTATPTCGGVACAYDVLLIPGPGSKIFVEGCQYVWPACWGFSKEVEVRTFRAFGGLPRPLLASVSLDLPGSRCASSSTTYAGGVVTLESMAPAGGATVDLRSTDPSHVQVRPVIVPEGRRSARFTVAISPSWTGSAQIVASAGGAIGMALVDRHACYITIPPSVLRLLLMQGRPFGLLADGRVLFRGKAGDALYDPKSQESVDLSSLLKLSDPTVVAYTPGGELLGNAKQGDSPVAFLWNMHQEEARAYKDVEPVGINPLGLALARDLTAPGEWRALDETGARPLPKLQSLMLSRAAGNSAGQFAVGLLSDQKPMPALVYEDSVSVLSQFEGEAVDTIASGMVVGHARNAQGQMQPFRWEPKKGLVWQPLPSGCSSATVKDLNEAGWFTGTADCGKSGPVPYLTDNVGKVIRIDQVAQEKGVTFVEALALSDTNTVLLRGLTSDGADVYYLLHP